jgi:hypothetical protein
MKLQFARPAAPFTPDPIADAVIDCGILPPLPLHDYPPSPEPIIRSRSTQRPTYLIIEYVALDGPQRYRDCGPELAETFDYLTFYVAGRADLRPLPILGYEILHRYHRAMDLIGARAHSIAWRSTLWRRAQSAVQRRAIA